MELKFKKEYDERYKTVDTSGDVMIKPFLTIAELNTIVLELKEKKSALERHFAKNVLLVDFCSNLDITNMKADEVYDLASELGLIETFQIYLAEYNMIDDIIKADESIYNVVKEISDSLTPQINDALKNIGDGSGLLNKFKGVIGNVNK